eukprot:4133382-Pyramimonas_sp.AAC.1
MCIRDSQRTVHVPERVGHGGVEHALGGRACDLLAGARGAGHLGGDGLVDGVADVGADELIDGAGHCKGSPYHPAGVNNRVLLRAAGLVLCGRVMVALRTQLERTAQ